MLLVVIIHAIEKWIEDVAWMKKWVGAADGEGSLQPKDLLPDLCGATVALRGQRENENYKVWSTMCSFYTFRISSECGMVVWLVIKSKWAKIFYLINIFTSPKMLFFWLKCLAIGRIERLWFIVMAFLLVLFVALDCWWNQKMVVLRVWTLGWVLLGGLWTFCPKRACHCGVSYRGASGR
jgi:hypothetical protein